MKNIIRSIILLIICGVFSNNLSAEKYLNEKPHNSSNRVAATACLPATAATDLSINNVRARINTGGDMWWDLQNVSEYEIPKGSRKTSMFSASLWMAGEDVNGQLKCAAQRYRGHGNDFWTGPLTTDGTAAVDAETCDDYDRHFVITRGEVNEFIAWFADKDAYPDYKRPKIIDDWPAHGDLSKNQSYYLAPFFDYDGDLSYDPDAGDYPYYDTDNSLCKQDDPTMEGNGILVDQVLKGDQTLWWVFNDKGNIHTETTGAAIGVEIRAQAFAFATNDEINNMTFYSYEIINRSTYRLTETYFSQWVDTDLGYAYDDFVGCDILRGLGYCYNGVSVDGTGKYDHYGEQPPAVGVDFFQGPYMDADGIDNPNSLTHYTTIKLYNINASGDTLNYNVIGNDTLINPPVIIYDSITHLPIDTTYLYYTDTTGSYETLICDVNINGVNFGDDIIDNERFGMRKFVYHNNTGSGGLEAMTDPDYAVEYYQFLKGFWKDNTRMQYGGNAHPNSSPPAYGPDCDFMFPGDTDPCNWGTGGQAPNGQVYWTEEEAHNPPYDRRFMQSAGPFTLEAGAVNYITVGIPWARASTGGPFASVELLRTVDDKCQRLFDNCFKVVDGPDAPDLIIRELDKELILYISNRPISNNYNEEYEEWDPGIISPDSLQGAARYDSLYRFEGYKIYQIKSATVSIADLSDPDLARLVAQCDKKNDVGQLVNYYYSDAVAGNMPVEEVNGADEGIVHSFKITEDQFASGDRTLVNHKKYYFIAIAYAYNEYKKYSQDPAILEGLYGQKKPYLAGRKSSAGLSITFTTGIPHITSPEANGTVPLASYGDGPKITRIEGQGNGGNALEFTTKTIDEIMAGPPWKSLTPEYDYSIGPIKVKVIDPLNIKKADYTLKFIPDTIDPNNISLARWVLIDDTNPNDTNSFIYSERSIEIGNEQLIPDIGLSIQIEQTVDPGEEGAIDNGFIESSIAYADSSERWFSGVSDYDGSTTLNWIRSGTREDNAEPENNDYEPGNLGKDWMDPKEYYEKVVNGTFAPYRLTSKYENGPAWSQYIVMNKIKNTSSIMLVLTSDDSKWTRCPVIELCDDESLAEGGVAKFNIRAGNSVDKNGNAESGRGMSWFPGYAINLETGERLNMMFGEDSWLVGENARDMIWNPTSNYYTSLGEVLFGGKHVIYIMGHNYDSQYDCPVYDNGAWLYGILSQGSFNPPSSSKRNIYKDVMWVGMPMLDRDYSFKDPQDIPTDVTIIIKVAKPYKKNYSTYGANPAQNGNYPMYTFNTDGIATIKNDNETAKNALDLINIVPNPYYAFSGYEVDQLDNRVKITNLPVKSTISIYTVNGVLVRQFNVDKSGVSSLKELGDTEPKTSIDWDLKNHAGIPIAGGLYLIHVKAEGIGERVIKWFGTLRPIDLNSF